MYITSYLNNIVKIIAGGIVVGISIRLGVSRQRNCGSIPSRGTRILSFSQNTDRLYETLSLLSNINWEDFPHG
jgi:hypothetical protein